MLIEEVPVCDRCLHRTDTVGKLEQHAQAIRISAKRKQKANSVNFATGNISLYHPLDLASDFTPRDDLKQLNSTRPDHSRTDSSHQHDAVGRRPAWMNLLPSNVNGDIRPPTYSAMHRRLSFPYFQSTRLSTPFSTPPEYPPGGSEYALAVSNATEGVPEELIVTPVTSHIHPSRSRSTPHSYAFAGRRQRGNLRIDHSSPITNFQDLPASLYEVHEPGDHPRRDQVAGSPTEMQLKREMVAPSSQSHKRRLSQRETSATQPDASCHAHTPIAAHAITAAKPPYYKELSGFFATREGKWLLPSRVSESRESTEQQVCVSSCSQCGAEAFS